jgi:hypothetical protein
MRGCRWLSIQTIGLVSCLLAGCLHTTPPPEAPMPRSNLSARAPANGAEEENQPHSLSSDYLVSRTPMVKLDVQQAAATENATDKPAEKRAEKPAEKPVEPVDMCIKSAEPSSPEPPATPPEPRREAPSSPLSLPDAPSVQVLRALLDHHSEEEINEQLKLDDPITRQVKLVLLESVAQLEQSGGIARISPRDLTALMDRLNTLTASLRGRSQLVLEHMCFCCRNSIKNFGDYTPLPPEYIVFQPDEMGTIYVQVRNISFRRLRDKYVTVLKARFEIYDENNRDKPSVTWASPLRQDVRASPCQDYYINFHFQVPRDLPAGLHTMRIIVEDWTDAPPDAKQVPESRIAQRTLDFRVGGPLACPARTRIAEVAPPQ